MSDVSPTGVWTLTTFSQEGGAEPIRQKIERGCAERATAPSMTTLRQTGLAGYTAGELVQMIHDLCDHWQEPLQWCWLWHGKVIKERPQICLDGKWYNPGHILYELEFGRPVSSVRKSVCGSRLCVRPHHQFFYGQ